MGTKPEIQAVVLAGGTGTRIKELTKKRPKCLLPIANRPMIYYPLKSLLDAGFAGQSLTALLLHHFNLTSPLTRRRPDHRA